MSRSRCVFDRRRISGFLEFVFLSAWITVCCNACSTGKYEFVPDAPPGGAVQDRTGDLTYRVPRESTAQVPAEGRVRLHSYGIENLDGADSGRDSPSAFHVRLEFQNDSKASWIFPVHEQSILITLPQEAPVQRVILPLDLPLGEKTEVAIAPGERRSVDLYFPLPEQLRGTQELSGLGLQWRVQYGSRLLKEITAFDRVRVSPPLMTVNPFGPYPYDPAFGYGWGSFWWYDPYYSDLTSMGPAYSWPWSPN